MYLIFILLVMFSFMCEAHGIIVPGRCEPNEIFACRWAYDKTCATLGSPSNFLYKNCVSMCYCKNGYARNEFGICIPIKDCPALNPVCSPLEELVPCSPSCPPEQSCETYFQPVEYVCAQPLPNAPCIPRCKCIKGYIRNSKGVCVKPEQCCDADPNAEVVGCPSPCPHTCNDTKTACKTLCQQRGCHCKQGYILDKENGKCIKFSECPNPLCQGPYEEYKNCKTPCPETCESINNPVHRPDCFLSYPCRGACECLPGYVRDSNDICIRKEDCPHKCKQHEVYNPCPGYCTFDEDCGSYIYGYVRDCAAPPDEVFPCYPRCDCEQGYLRINDTCQLPINCCDDPNSQIVDCPADCDKNCDGNDVADCNMNCFQKACRCLPGYVKDENGKCIPQEKCPVKCKEHEVYNPCPRYCTFDEDCGSYIYGFIRDCAPPPPGPYPCYPRCDCEPGYVRINGICQLPIQCCEDINAQVVKCPAACDKTCDGKDVAGCNKNCIRRACRCLPGYVRDKNGKCIPKNKCTLQCKVNERYNPCPAWCKFDSDCDSYVRGWIRDCTTTPKGQISCIPRCECIDGFVRINGNCVSANFCCKVLNAVVVNCPAECDKTCDGKNVADCDKNNCFHKTCRCVPGFVRDNNGNCIPKKNCPLQCKPTEVLNPCPKYCTFDTDCDSYLYGRIKDCSTTPVGGVPCKPRCECKPGLVRINRDCVSPNLCCGDPNAIVVKCPNPCPKTCDNYNTIRKIPCLKKCRIIGCTCRDGFVLDSKGKCIKACRCSKDCTCPNEEYNSCGSSEDILFANRSLKSTFITVCIPGCYCKKGFVRKNGDCV